ncbi:hypothetical protein DFP72DRAFT_860240 [Ephemerocybe angulata]|uniref:Uncharacterized protein n=1 Tax=Ephemerocybe angulata TaxID=980116 RepID=A0A8H6HAS6_9AGAR|nr:hypothetical protein DFP72DRAFT_860240 [Tulosesus angulatus]
MAATIIYNRLVVHGLARALALTFTDAHPGIDRYVVLALALDGDRTRGSVITADHTRTVARVAARVRDVLLPPQKRDFTEILGEVALELLRQAEEGDVEGLRIRACLVAGILDGTAVLEQAISCVVMRYARVPQVYLDICEEMWRRSEDILSPADWMQDVNEVKAAYLCAFRGTPFPSDHQFGTMGSWASVYRRFENRYMFSQRRGHGAQNEYMPTFKNRSQCQPSARWRACDRFLFLFPLPPLSPPPPPQTRMEVGRMNGVTRGWFGTISWAFGTSIRRCLCRNESDSRMALALQYPAAFRSDFDENECAACREASFLHTACYAPPTCTLFIFGSANQTYPTRPTQSPGLRDEMSFVTTKSDAHQIRTRLAPGVVSQASEVLRTTEELEATCPGCTIWAWFALIPVCHYILCVSKAEGRFLSRRCGADLIQVGVEEPMAPRSDHFASLDEEVEAGIVITDDEFIAEAREAVKNMDLGKDGWCWGIDVYCEVVLRLTGHFGAGDD